MHAYMELVSRVIQLSYAYLSKQTPEFPVQPPMFSKPYSGNKVARQVHVKTSSIAAEIIGKEGGKIKQIIDRTSTKILSPKKNEPPIFSITGYRDQVNDAEREILKLVVHFENLRNKEKKDNKLPDGFVRRNVRVSGKHVGLIVGKNGKTIQRIKRLTHTEIKTPDKGTAPIFVIEGLACDVDRAGQLITDEVDKKTGPGPVHPVDDSATFSVKRALSTHRPCSFLNNTSNNSSFFNQQPNYQRISRTHSEEFVNNLCEKPARPFCAASRENQPGRFVYNADNEAFLPPMLNRYPSTAGSTSEISLDSVSPGSTRSNTPEEETAMSMFFYKLRL